MSALVAGRSVLHYRILRQLGAGGMGEVYLAEDAKLGRQVALKVLAHESAQDPDRRARFEREARAIAALNHPNIVTIHSVEEDQGILFITMELVEGMTLADVIPAEGMSLDTLLKTAIPLADAVGTAHRRGITHRDLKPANVMISHEGRVKVLDFGLARQQSQISLQDETVLQPTAHATAEGRILGTVAYMSPEQVEGKNVDQRSDVFSLGIVLFEMATGDRPFKGDSNVAVLSSVLKDRPPLVTDVRADMPRELARVVSRCLEKDPEERYQTAKDLRNDLKALKADSDSGELSRRSASVTASAAIAPSSTVQSATPVARRSGRLALAGVGLALAAGAVVAISHATAPRVPRVNATRQITTDGAKKYWPMTDGARLYFSVEHLRGQPGAGFSLAQVSVAGGDTVQLASTPGSAIYPLDIDASGSELLIEHSPGTGDAELAVRPLVGGDERPVGDIRINSGIYGMSATWTPDNSHVIYAKGNQLRSVRNDGSESRVLLTAPGIPFAPRVSPDGAQLRYSVREANRGATTLWEAGSDGSSPHPLLPGWTGARDPCCGTWTPDGRYYVFEANANIWARPEATGIWGRAGEPVPLTVGPLRFSGVVPSRDGKRLFVVGDQLRGRLARFDPTTKGFVDYLGAPSIEGVAFSADGGSIAYTAFPEGTLWRSRVDGSSRVQLTFPPMTCLLPRWSPDGSRVAFSGAAPGDNAHIYVVPAAGGAARRVTSSKVSENDPSWSPDGRRLVFGAQLGGDTGAAARPALDLVDLESGRITTLPGSTGLFSPRWSPDGRFILALTSDSTRLMLFDVAGSRWTELSRATEIAWPNWSPDSASVLFVMVSSTQRDIRRVEIATGAVSVVVETTGRNQLTGFAGRWLGVTADGGPMIALDAGTHDIYALEWDAP